MNRCRTKTGFTLIELVASAVLTTLLMTALVNVVWSSLRESRRLKEQAVSGFSVSYLTQQLRMDFQNARGMAIASDGIALHGFVGGGQAQLPGAIQYRIRNSNGRRVLGRISDANGFDPLWIGIGGFQIEPLELSDPEDDLLPSPALGGLPEIPAKFRVTLLGERNQVLWREVIHHHEI